LLNVNNTNQNGLAVNESLFQLNVVTDGT